MQRWLSRINSRRAAAKYQQFHNKLIHSKAETRIERNHVYDTDDAVLTREFIYGSLYAKDAGYFANTERQVLHAPRTYINFSNLWGEMEYRHVVARLYQEEREAWLTPVEVFAPYYSYAIGNYILHSPHFHPELRIIEIGGGSGTNALHLLNFLQEHAPEVYEKTKYTLVEISPVMAARQRQRLMRRHSQQCKVINTDFLTYSDVHKISHERCFVLALEVLDNLPHDKVTIQTNGKWYETVVCRDKNPSSVSNEDSIALVEKLRPLQDPLIRQTIEYFGCELPVYVRYKFQHEFARKIRKWIGKCEQDLNSAFVPSGAMQLLNTLRSAFPNHHLIAADFDSLPAPNLGKSSRAEALHHPFSPTATTFGPLCAANAPLVASKTLGVTEDHDTYFIQGGIADIFFATDFLKLKDAYCKIMDKKPHEVSVVKSGAFLNEFADVNKTKTITGYNPLLQDYTNTSFILS